jgi:hypothetical protein
MIKAPSSLQGLRRRLGVADVVAEAVRVRCFDFAVERAFVRDGGQSRLRRELEALLP